MVLLFIITAYVFGGDLDLLPDLGGDYSCY